MGRFDFSPENHLSEGQKVVFQPQLVGSMLVGRRMYFDDVKTYHFGKLCVQQDPVFGDISPCKIGRLGSVGCKHWYTAVYPKNVHVKKVTMMINYDILGYTFL